MPKYEVEVKAQVTGSITIEADSAEQAELYAQEQFDLDMSEPEWCIVDSVDIDVFETEEE